MNFIDSVINVLVFVFNDIEEFFIVEMEELVNSVIGCLKNVF